jgi:hypothetical protein
MRVRGVARYGYMAQPYRTVRAAPPRRESPAAIATETTAPKHTGKQKTEIPELAFLL